MSLNGFHSLRQFIDRKIHQGCHSWNLMWSHGCDWCHNKGATHSHNPLNHYCLLNRQFSFCDETGLKRSASYPLIHSESLQLATTEGTVVLMKSYYCNITNWFAMDWVIANLSRCNYCCSGLEIISPFGSQAQNCCTQRRRTIFVQETERCVRTNVLM